MRFKTDHLAFQLAFEAGHHGNHDDQNANAEHNANDRYESDDRKKGPLRPKISQRDKITEWKERFFHVGRVRVAERPSSQGQRSEPAPKGQNRIAQGFSPGFDVLTRCTLPVRRSSGMRDEGGKEAPDFGAADRTIGEMV